MLDKTSLAFLDFLEQQPDGKFFYENDPPEHLPQKGRLLALVNYLEARDFVETIRKPPSNYSAGVQLTHKGYCRKEFRKHETRLYWKDKWIDCVSLLVSIAAIIISLIALLPKK